jgi:hypothetical protein
VETDGLFSALLDRHAASAVIVRPDRYIYAVTRDADALNMAVERLAAQLRS